MTTRPYLWCSKNRTNGHYCLDKWQLNENKLTGFLSARIKMPKKNAKLLSSYFSPLISFSKAKNFIDEIMRWDGTDNMRGNTRYYSSVIKENADLVAAIAVQSGYKVLCGEENDFRKKSYSKVYRVYINPKQEVCTKSFRRDYVPYNGNVYCVEVPSHMIVVRSEGYVFISGNCPHNDTDKRNLVSRSMDADYVLALGAVVTWEERLALERAHGSFIISEFGLTDAIDNGIIPIPTINVMHLKLDDTKYVYMHEGAKFTAKGYYNILQKKVKNAVAAYEAHNSYITKQRMLLAGNERKKFMGKLKQNAMRDICEKLEAKGKRFLCFCSSIKQAEELGEDNAFTSKTPTSMKLLDKFNNKEINSLYVVGKLIEGQNLKDIECGVIGQLGGTERITVQSIGRVLRAKNPEVYVLVFDDTKDKAFLKTLTNNVSKEYIKHYNY